MARNYGRIVTSMWREADWRSLTTRAQHAYMMLFSQANITAAGVLPLTISRWSGCASDMTSDALSDALSELRADRKIVVDHGTQELLVRKFVKWDAGYNNDKRRPIILREADEVESSVLRRAIAEELDILNVAHSLWDGLEDRGADALSDSLSDALPDSHTRFDGLRVNSSKQLKPQPLNRNPQPGSPAQSAAPGKPVATPSRGTRLPEDWTPSARLVEWARSEGIPDDVQRHETAQFMDHWLAKAGRDAIKVDWDRTWQKWLRGAKRPAQPVRRSQQEINQATLALLDGAADPFAIEGGSK